jgi:hypothetical protein
MATYTAAQVADEVLEATGRKSVHQAANAKLKNTVVKYVTATHAELRDAGIVAWASSACPEKALVAFRDVVAYKAKSVLALSGERLQIVIADYRAGMKTLAAQGDPGPPPMPLRSEYM